jgi:hypothetical protein
MTGLPSLQDAVRHFVGGAVTAGCHHHLATSLAGSKSQGSCMPWLFGEGQAVSEAVCLQTACDFRRQAGDRAARRGRVEDNLKIRRG